MSDVLFDEVSRCRQEITRLTREIERLTLDGIHTCHAECQRPLCKLTRERDALLEACRFYASMMGRRKSDGEPFYMTALDLDCGDRARAAIKAVEDAK